MLLFYTVYFFICVADKERLFILIAKATGRLDRQRIRQQHPDLYRQRFRWYV